LVNRRLARPVERVEDAKQAAAEPVSLGELVLESSEVIPDDLGQGGPVALEQRAYLVEAESQPPQGDDPVEPRDVVVAVKAVAGRSALRGLEQAELVVVVERTDRQGRAPSPARRSSTVARSWERR
jgi:hypothetical protein